MYGVYLNPYLKKKKKTIGKNTPFMRQLEM